MLIKRKSLMSGKVHEMDIPITQTQLDAYYSSGVMIDRMFPDLTADQREFIMTGITSQEWQTMFPPEDDE